jgi:hypothetical protein
MASFAIRLIRKALTIILESLKGMQNLWGLKNQFESEKRSPRGELLLAISILGNMVPVLYPIIGGAPFLVSLILIVISIISYWLLRMGISDPRLWNWTGVGIGIEAIGLILGGFYLPHVGLNIIQHIFRNVIVRTAAVTAGSVTWAATTYVASAQPGDFEGQSEPVRGYKAASIHDYGYKEPKKYFQFPDFGDYSYYDQWDNAEWQHNK